MTICIVHTMYTCSTVTVRVLYIYNVESLYNLTIILSLNSISASVATTMQQNYSTCTCQLVVSYNEAIAIHVHYYAYYMTSSIQCTSYLHFKLYIIKHCGALAKETLRPQFNDIVITNVPTRSYRIKLVYFVDRPLCDRSQKLCEWISSQRRINLLHWRGLYKKVSLCLRTYVTRCMHILLAE